MPLVIANSIKPNLLGPQLDYLRSCMLCLFKEDLTPHGNLNAPTFLAVECAFPGYVRQPLTDYSNIYLDALDKAHTETNVHTFTASGASDEIVYGAFAIDPDDNLVWSEKRDGGGVQMFVAGATFTCLSHYTLTGEGPGG